MTKTYNVVFSGAYDLNFANKLEKNIDVDNVIAWRLLYVIVPIS